jgi:uncharacterized protein YjbJ (UPF0337 family)
MGEHWDKTKGNVKEAAGKATGDEELEAEGQTDQAKGSLKGAWDDVKDAVSGDDK